jgi:hypothetical protein
MFDPGICSQMKQESEAHVSSGALLALKSLLSTGPYSVESMVFEAQHLSSTSGDADAFAVTLVDQSRRAVSPPTKLPQWPTEAHQKMVRLLARMLNEHLLHRPSPARLEMGDE